MNPGLPLQETTSWMVNLGGIPFLSISHSLTSLAPRKTTLIPKPQTPTTTSQTRRFADSPTRTPHAALAAEIATRSMPPAPAPAAWICTSAPGWAASWSAPAHRPAAPELLSGWDGTKLPERHLQLRRSWYHLFPFWSILVGEPSQKKGEKGPWNSFPTLSRAWRATGIASLCSKSTLCPFVFGKLSQKLRGNTRTLKRTMVDKNGQGIKP